MDFSSGMMALNRVFSAGPKGIMLMLHAFGR
jgi:hypothetical protein